jgi:MFS family permease
MQRIAIGWLTWQMTKSGLWLGIVAFADFFPVVLIGPIAGAAADRWDRLRVVKTSQTISLVQATVLFALTASGHMNIGLLLALTALQGVVVAFNQPARLALVPSLVAERDLASAVAISSIVFNLARFVGPMFAEWNECYSLLPSLSPQSRFLRPAIPQKPDLANEEPTKQHE